MERTRLITFIKILILSTIFANVLPINTICSFVRRRKPDVLEYLDLCTDPPLRLPASSCHSRMQSQSACDCYCKTRVPIARQREEIQYARSGIRGSRSSVRRTETARSARKVTLTAAKAVNDEQVSV